MGLYLAKKYVDNFSEKQINALMLGLQGSGKTTMLYRIKIGEILNCIPTITTNIQLIKFKKTDFQIQEVGGIAKNSWQTMMENNTKALIFVVDSSDHDNIQQSKIHLHKILSEKQSQNMPLLVMANKQEKNKVLNCSEIVQMLDLRQIKGRQWKIIGTSVYQNKGLNDGFEWLRKQIKKKKSA